MVLFCLSHTSEHPPPPRPTQLPSVYYPAWIFPKCDTEGQFTPRLVYVLWGIPSLCMVLYSESSTCYIPSICQVLDSYPKYSIWVCNYTLHILATAYFLPASLRESSKPEEQIQMVLSLASSIQNSRWQDFIWKRTRLTQHLFLLTSHFYDQRFWSFPPLLSRKNTTPELHGKRLSIIWGKYLICFHRHAEEDSLAVRS